MVAAPSHPSGGVTSKATSATSPARAKSCATVAGAAAQPAGTSRRVVVGRGAVLAVTRTWMGMATAWGLAEAAGRSDVVVGRPGCPFAGAVGRSDVAVGLPGRALPGGAAGSSTATTRTGGSTTTDRAGSTSTGRVTDPYGRRGTGALTGAVYTMVVPSTTRSTATDRAACRHGRCRSAESATW